MNASTRQHTPGPWDVEGSYVHGPDGKRFLAVASDGEGQANARLIASAPALLEALEELERLTVWVGGQNPVHDAIESAKRKARAAIAKATGGDAS